MITVHRFELDAIAKHQNRCSGNALMAIPMGPVDPADAFKQRVQQSGRRLKTGASGRRDLLKSFGRQSRRGGIMRRRHQ